MTDSPADAIAILRIEIKYIEPLIWRRVAVRTSMNLEALHTVIQATMGWLDYHLWELVVEERKYGIPDPERPHVKNGATTQLATVPASGVTEFGYVYDFGDNWEHRIVVEEVRTAEAGAKYSCFLGGSRSPEEQRDRVEAWDLHAHGRHLAEPLCRARNGRSLRRAATRRTTRDWRRRNLEHDPQNVGDATKGWHTLEPQEHG